MVSLLFVKTVSRDGRSSKLSMLVKLASEMPSSEASSWLDWVVLAVSLSDCSVRAVDDDAGPDDGLAVVVVSIRLRMARRTLDPCSASAESLLLASHIRYDVQRMAMRSALSSALFCCCGLSANATTVWGGEGGGYARL